MSDNIHIKADAPVTTIIVQRPFAQHAAAYEDWLKEIIPAAKDFPGHLAVNIIRPHGHTADYTIVLHFDSEANLRNWLNSPIRKDLIEKVRPLLNSEEEIKVNTGIEYWFTPPSSSRVAPLYKQFLITLSAIYPLTMIIPVLLEPVFEAMPPFTTLPVLKGLLIATVIVALMTFVIMPRYVRLVSKWLFR